MILYWEGHIIQGRPEEIAEFIRINTPCTVTTTTMGTSNWPQPNSEDLKNKSICNGFTVGQLTEMLEGFIK